MERLEEILDGTSTIARNSIELTVTDRCDKLQGGLPWLKRGEGHGLSGHSRLMP